MAEPVRDSPLIIESPVQCQTCRYKICSDQEALRQVFGRTLSCPPSVLLHPCSILIHPSTNHAVSFYLPVRRFSLVTTIPPLLHTHSSIFHPHFIIFSPSTSVFPCRYYSTIAPYSFINLPPTLYNVFLPVRQCSPVTTIPPLLHTHSSIYHPHYIIFFSQYFSFPLSVLFHHCPIHFHQSYTHAL